MADKIEFLIPFDEIVDDDGWRRFFPCRTVYHMGQTIDFTIDRGFNMVSNFKNNIPDYSSQLEEALHRRKIDNHPLFSM